MVQKRKVLIFIFLFSLLTLNSFAGNTITYGNIECKFIRNYDGDTITVNIPNFPDIIGKKISIRINGIDTPEMRDKDKKIKELARNAKKLVNNLCKNASIIELRNMKRGKYFRIVADVYIDDVSIADILIKNGLAKPYDGGKKPKW